MARVQTIKIVKRRCDTLYAQIIAARANGRCEWCHRRGANSHHMIGRARNIGRYDLRNGVYLCVGCHREFHDVCSLGGWQAFRRSRPKDYEWVLASRNTSLKRRIGDYLLIEKQLQKVLDEMKFVK